MKATVLIVRRMILLLVLAACVSSSVLFADGYFVGNGMNGKRLAVFEPEYKGLGAADEAAMLDLVNIIRMDLHDFAGFH